ncbi:MULTISPECIES: uracil-xanthine permease family protein [Brevibacillus]|uniref:Xanthine/uracil permease family protein n=1 Tax=Brevibacillus borstelensis AK1 TaxID=1300222 RepID=M8DG67_9BACL|nr:nucleobase:cation symporter-2 family protein [Brevibacillus borstelensis]EMT52458.1 xanthine/uracil permease family protein [Brevibacillus borstelensis AK1]KKX55233.1 xanthine/uracil permease [Brevibacillus borstelensis cifa_chp40]MCC0563146.1 purine permease [Brevibacillus borstelensis]MCM3469089.1 purine permease [Brevibacillus borstelensis]MCM3559898.1 purine permease [Brevibacillus borstelensis]
MEQQRDDVRLVVGVDDKISVGKAFLLGLQHVLAMDLYIAPIIIAGLLTLDTSSTSFFIQMCFLATGIGTLIQTGFGIRLPVVQGPSYVPIGALAAIGSKLGMAAMIGSIIPGALLMAFVGYPLKWFAKAVRRFIPPLVGGTVIVIVGIALMPTAMANIYNSPGSIGTNSLIAAVSAAVLVACMLLGQKAGKAGTFFRLVSVLIAIFVGTVTAAFFGGVDFSSVKSAAWLSLPKFFPYGAPVFDISAILTMVFVYLIIMIETTGTWFVVSSVTGKELTEERLNRASLGEGLGCFVGALFGGTPMTGYSSNAGLLAVTGVASRMAIMAGGIILIALGLVPKLSAAITCIPEPVINGIFGIVCVAIVTNGLKVIQHITIDERNMMVIGLPILLTIAVTVLPKDALQGAPDFVNYILSSNITVGALATLILNQVIPDKKSWAKQGVTAESRS